MKAILALVIIFAPLAAQAQLLKCVGKDGKVTYQSEKCADAVRESKVRPPDPPSARTAPPPIQEAPADPAPGGASAEPPVDMETFVSQISSFENCAVVVPGFAGKHKANFDRWKERHRSAFARYNQDGNAMRRVRESAEYVRGKMAARTPEERDYDTQNCESTIATAFAPPQAPLNPLPQNPPTSIPTKN